jgi:hypothetical protein
VPPGLRFICARRPAETCRVMRAGSILTYPRQVLLRMPVIADLGRADRDGQSVPCVSPARSRFRGGLRLCSTGGCRRRTGRTQGVNEEWNRPGSTASPPIDAATAASAQSGQTPPGLGTPTSARTGSPSLGTRSQASCRRYHQSHRDRQWEASETLSRWALAVGRPGGLGCVPGARHCSLREPTPGSYTANPSAS